MKTIYRNTLLALVALAVGCMNTGVEIDSVQTQLKASMEYNGETKTTLSDLEGGKYYPLWCASDQIAVYADNDTAPTKFNLISGEGTTTALFSGSRVGAEYFALYPFSAAGTIADGAVTITLPATQMYADGSFADGAFPMVALGTEGILEFKNLCAVLKVTLTGNAVIKSVTLTANDSNTFLSGAATVQRNYGSTPQLTMAAGGSTSVTVDCKGLELKDGETKDAYIVIPAQTYKGGLTIDIDTYTETVTHKIESDLTFDRSQLRKIKDAIVVNVTYDGIVADAVPDNEIWYVMSDGSIYDVYQTTQLYGHQPFDANVISNTYENGIGKIRCDKAITKINDHTFGNCWAANMTELYLPDCIEYLGTGAIDYTGLKTLRIPRNLKAVGSYGLNNPNMESFTGEHVSADGRSVIIEDGFMPNYGDTLTPVKNYMAAFAPAGITEYTIPNNVEILGWYTFALCPELRKITLNEGLKAIMGCCFMGTHLDCEITLPSTLESLDSYAFNDCSGIKGFYGNEKFHTSDHLCLIFEQTAFCDEPEKNGKWINRFVGYDITDYSIPEGIKGIENYSFDQLPNLKTVTLPSSIVEVGAYAFNHCDNLEALYGECVSDDHKAIVFDTQFRKLVITKGVVNYTIPDEITSIGYQAFTESPEIETITMGDQITYIKGYAFAWCPNLKSVTLSAGLKDISGFNAFLNSENLETIYMRSLVPPAYMDTQMNDFPKLTIYVPRNSLGLYQNSPSWTLWRDYFQPYDYTDLPTPDYYISTDYSQDGAMTLLQRASKGNGIDIVLMGDGYSDRQIADGTYERVMKLAYEKLFTEEPYKSHKELFNVYYVTAVSATEGYEYGNTAFNGWFGDGSAVGGSDNNAMNYALNAVEESRLNNTTIVVMMNSDRYAGTCYMYYPDGSNDYGSGVSVSYFPVGTDEAQLEQLLHHETCGHGFTKLADEYAYDYMGAVPADQVAATQSQWAWGWWKNVDFTSDTSKVLWSKFIADERYKYDGLGAFEGGLTYWTGVWRPTENSIMRYNTGGFNAPSREAIYYRIHKLAYGDSWQYDYEKFVEYDAINRKTGAEQAAAHTMVLRPFAPTAPPVVVGKTWREALGK